jgi:hypothetical protein
MDLRLLIRLVLALFMALLAFAPSYAQQRTLNLNDLTTSSVAPDSTDEWGFPAYSGEVVSLLVQAEGDFDPMLTLQDGAGRLLVASDDYDYPNSRDSLLEAVTLPRTDTYTAAISGFSGTGGGYSVRLLPGFAQLHAEDNFEGDANWRAADAGAQVAVRDGTLNVSIPGSGEVGTVISNTVEPTADLYAHVRVASITHTNGWVIGISARRQGGSSITAEVNERGLWRATATSGGTTRTLRDWTPHPNIVPGETSFTLGLMIKGVGIDVFYDGGFVGSAQETEVTGAGQIGLVVTTPGTPGSQVTVQFDDFIVTVPFAAHTPQQITLGDGIGMVMALRRNHVVSAEGEMVLTVPEVTAEYARPGINRVMVGRGTTYTNFALGATLDINASRNGLAGCGLIVRSTGEEDYTMAFIDQMGGYGMSKRTGSEFEPGLFGENRVWAGRNHHLLMIADANTLYYYIDGRIAGTLDNPPQSGEVGTAVVNYESINTSCRFTNLWLWRW